MYSLRRVSSALPRLTVGTVTSRAFASAPGTRYPTGQHVAQDGEELEREKHKSLKDGKKEWNEKLASVSEAHIKAHKDTRSPKELAEETVSKAKVEKA